ncbi:acetyltransferase [Christiangramia sp. OXR-203]|jgi:acetyltransferase EpsM|uniref:acetyltransferase n=1 Tax=Christiangramia sp. OXR-203 TaxID=3100176 RepID=UPI002AC92097|nr:acetyltransferase [Christiangramia sp. OXR-203]WPY99736.1 acetyltransferase [Christiangramia sp. OXR-203]
MILFGASGHAKVILDIINSGTGDTVDYILDDNSEIFDLAGFQVDHAVDRNILQTNNTIVAIGDNKIRKNICVKYNIKLHEALIHKTATVSKAATVSKGSVVMAGAVINHSAKIGENSIINSNAIIEHDVSIAKFVHVSPSASVTGGVSIGEGSHIGAGASIIPGIKIGKWVTIGAGAVILKDVPDHAVVVGNPGRIIKYNKN